MTEPLTLLEQVNELQKIYWNEKPVQQVCAKLREVVEAANNLLLVSSEETRTRLDGEKNQHVETSLQEVKQLQVALTPMPED